MSFFLSYSCQRKHRNQNKLSDVADDFINWRVSPSFFSEAQELSDNDDHQNHSPGKVRTISGMYVHPFHSTSVNQLSTDRARVNCCNIPPGRKICNRSELVADGSPFFNRNSLRRQILDQVFSIPKNRNSCSRLAPMARHVCGCAREKISSSLSLPLLYESCSSR